MAILIFAEAFIYVLISGGSMSRIGFLIRTGYLSTNFNNLII